MLRSARSPLGAPGVFALPDVRPVTLHPQRMDVAAFVGVAPRGPAWQPLVNDEWPPHWQMVTEAARPLRRSVAVPVRSFDDYVRIFGGFEGPGLLPHAVASFFEQGGELAWVVRVVHERAAQLGDAYSAQVTLAAPFTLPLAFIARNPGRWGDAVRVQCSLSAQAVAFEPVPLLPPHVAAITVSADAALPSLQVGDAVRLWAADGSQVLAWCEALNPIADPDLPGVHAALPRLARAPRTRLQPVFDLGDEAAVEAALGGPVVRLEVLRAQLQIDDGRGLVERFDDLGLSPSHPRSLVSVLVAESALVWPHPDWAAQPLVPASLASVAWQGVSALSQAGRDDHAEITPADFFDALWSPTDDAPGQGLMALAVPDADLGQGDGLAAVTQVLVPDLYVPAAFVPADDADAAPESGASAVFSACVDAVLPATAGLVSPSVLQGLILDPRKPTELLEITRWQQAVLAFCEATGRIALLDVPPGLSQGAVERWRAAFDSSWVAAYHPWLRPARRGAGGRAATDTRALNVLPPSAVAAGVIAWREREMGLQVGPANEVARDVVDLAEPQADGRVDALHPLGLNAFVRGPRGIELVAARTLSMERQWRQLSVRRLVLMLCRTLRVETQWAVFEPNGPALWRDLQSAIEALLRRFFQRGMFAGRTEAESYFVRIDTDARRLDRGELCVDIGVAPAEPLEFILVRLRRDGDGTLRLEA